jgi:hypothetical protein
MSFVPNYQKSNRNNHKFYHFKGPKTEGKSIKNENQMPQRPNRRSHDCVCIDTKTLPLCTSSRCSGNECLRSLQHKIISLCIRNCTKEESLSKTLFLMLFLYRHWQLSSFI